MSFFCKLFRCKPNCDEARREEQADCERRINEVHRGHEAEYKKLNRVKKRWEARALKWEEIAGMRQENHLDCLGELSKCEEKLEECEDKPEPSKAIKSLAIQGGKFIVNGRETILIGCSRYKALFFEDESWEDWGVANLEEYESELIKSGINYVRHGTGKDMGLLRKHCIKMGDNGVFVEVGFYNYGLRERMGDYRQAVKATIDLPNVFYNAHNEFCAACNIDKAREIIKYVNDKGGICSAGAWGHSPNGQECSKMFDPINSDNQIIAVHREWTKGWIIKYLGHDKPVIRNEYFDINKSLGFAGMKRIMKETIDAGAQGCQYFMFNDNTWRERLVFAGEYCKRKNNI